MDIQGRLTRRIRRGKVTPVKIKPERQEKYMHSYARRRLKKKDTA